MKKNFLFLFLSLGFLLSFTSCVEERKKNNPEAEPTNSGSAIIEPTITYNIFVENSGSMKGFFNKKNTLKQIIREYYDRIDATKSPITLNLINTSIIRKKDNVDDYLRNLFSNCNASLSELDKILEMAMDTLGANEVNLVISDYCFESPNGNFVMARSHITNIFQKRLNSGKDLAVAIFKYDCDFNGRNYPSNRNCTHSVPAYVWAFGATSQIKKVMNLPIKVDAESMVLEPFKEITPGFINCHSRMVNKNNEIVVSEWKQERKTNDYKLDFELNLSGLAIGEEFLADLNNYEITPGYSLDTITREQGSDTYVFRIRTNHPSPGEVKIDLRNIFPQWVFDSNFESMTAVPDAGKTLGIKYLIEGVFDAYNYQNNSIFTVKIIIK